jgi:hypothetical protein
MASTNSHTVPGNDMSRYHRCDQVDLRLVYFQMRASSDLAPIIDIVVGGKDEFSNFKSYPVWHGIACEEPERPDCMIGPRARFSREDIAHGKKGSKRKSFSCTSEISDFSV